MYTDYPSPRRAPSTHRIFSRPTSALQPSYQQQQQHYAYMNRRSLPPPPPSDSDYDSH
jgi:hypothetical protein